MISNPHSFESGQNRETDVRCPDRAIRQDLQAMLQMTANDLDQQYHDHQRFFGRPRLLPRERPIATEFVAPVAEQHEPAFAGWATGAIRSGD